MDLADHLRMVWRHAGEDVVDIVLVNQGPIPEDVLARYEAEGTFPLTWPRKKIDHVPVMQRKLLAPGPKLRHDPAATANGLIAAWRSRLTENLTRPSVAEG